MTDVIAVFARAPQPGHVKTRLAKVIGDEAAVELYKAMLVDSLATAQRTEREVVVTYTPEHAFSPGPHSLNEYWQGARQQQISGDLGIRIVECVRQLQINGAKHVVVIGSDSPDLPASFIDAAFAALHVSPLVLGPAVDGGFYLLGTSGDLPDGLFQGVSWSSACTLAQVVANAAHLGQSSELLPPWQDVDEWADVQRLVQQAKNNQLQAPRTARWLRANRLLENI